jgi:hypothetical protein
LKNRKEILCGEKDGKRRWSDRKVVEDPPRLEQHTSLAATLFPGEEIRFELISEDMREKNEKDLLGNVFLSDLSFDFSGKRENSL